MTTGIDEAIVNSVLASLPADAGLKFVKGYVLVVALGSETSAEDHSAFMIMDDQSPFITVGLGVALSQFLREFTILERGCD